MRLVKSEEYHHLMKIKVYYQDQNQWLLRPESRLSGASINGKGEFTFRGDINSFAKFLMKIKAKDNETDPPSSRGKTYKAIAQEIVDGTDPYIYVWNTSWKRNFRPQHEKREVHEMEKFTLKKHIVLKENKIKKVKEVSSNRTEITESLNPQEIVNIIIKKGYYIYNNFNDSSISKVEKQLEIMGIDFITTSQTGTDYVIAKKGSFYYNQFMNHVKESIIVKKPVVVENYILEPGDKFQIIERSNWKYPDWLNDKRIIEFVWGNDYVQCIFKDSYEIFDISDEIYRTAVNKGLIIINQPESAIQYAFEMQTFEDIDIYEFIDYNGKVTAKSYSTSDSSLIRFAHRQNDYYDEHMYDTWSIKIYHWNPQMWGTGRKDVRDDFTEILNLEG